MGLPHTKLDIYVVLSRVRTSEGLFICEKLRDATNFVADPRLIQEEERLRTKEQELILFSGE